MNRALTSAFLGAALPFLPGAAKGQLQTSDGKLGPCAPSFAAPVVYPNAGRDSYSVAVADLNGDGNLDLVTANSYVKSVSVLLGKGDGTFQPATNYSVGSALGSAPYALTIGDFDGDGKPDVATANSGDLYGSNTVSVLLGNGDGTLRPAINNSLKDGFPAAGDFNGDGKLDLALANSFSDSVGLLLGNGDGTFRAGVDVGVGLGPDFVVAGDLNGDGKLDLCVVNKNSDSVSVLLGKGDGTFQRAVYYGVGDYPEAAVIGDFNDDGVPDIAVANSRDSISVLLNRGGGTFGPTTNYAGLGGPPLSLAAGDLNGDGKIDLAVPLNFVRSSTETNGSLLLFLGNGDGSFQTPVRFDPGTGIRPWAVAVGDFDRDGKLDVTVTSGTRDFPYARQYGVSVLLNTCPCAGVRLDVARKDTNVVLSWPVPYSNFVLEGASSLTSTNWQQTTEIITTNKGHYEVNVPLDQVQRYFRLRKP